MIVLGYIVPTIIAIFLIGPYFAPLAEIIVGFFSRFISFF